MSEKYKSIAEWLGGISLKDAKEAADAISMHYPSMELQRIPKQAWRWIATGNWPDDTNKWVTDMDDRAALVSLVSHFIGMNGHQKAIMIDIARYMGSAKPPTAPAPAANDVEVGPEHRAAFSTWTAPIGLDELPDLVSDFSDPEQALA